MHEQLSLYTKGGEQEGSRCSPFYLWPHIYIRAHSVESERMEARGQVVQQSHHSTQVWWDDRRSKNQPTDVLFVPSHAVVLCRP